MLKFVGLFGSFFRKKYIKQIYKNNFRNYSFRSEAIVNGSNEKGFPDTRKAFFDFTLSTID